MEKENMMENTKAASEAAAEIETEVILQYGGFPRKHADLCETGRFHGLLRDQ